jgi:hypothetical protein
MTPYLTPESPWGIRLRLKTILPAVEGVMLGFQ